MPPQEENRRWVVLSQNPIQSTMQVSNPASRLLIWIEEE